MPRQMPLQLVGLRLKAVRPMTPEEMRAEYWTGEQPGTVLVFEDGTKLFASRDDEGNGPGALFGYAPDGTGFRVM